MGPGHRQTNPPLDGEQNSNPKRSHALVTPESISRAINRLFGKRWAARYFRWQLVPLTPQEQAAMPPPKGGCSTPTYRLVFTFDAAAAAADARYDGLSVLFTTAPLHYSGDELFTKFKEQNYIELLHHQMKTPLAVRPVLPAGRDSRPAGPRARLAKSRRAPD